MEIQDPRFKEYVINRLTPFPTILSYAGYRGYSYDGTCYCPFHQNTDTPSAKIYKDSTGDTLWCFSEQKRYRPIDIIKRHLIKGKSIDTIFESLWRQISEDDKKQLLTDYGTPVSYIPPYWEERSPLLDKFKSGEIDINQYLIILKVCLQPE